MTEVPPAVAEVLPAVAEVTAGGSGGSHCRQKRRQSLPAEATEVAEVLPAAVAEVTEFVQVCQP